MVEFGFHDPGRTGQVFALLSAANRREFDQIEIIPDFSGRTLKIVGELTLRTNLARLIWPSIQFSFEPSVIRAVWRVMRNQ